MHFTHIKWQQQQSIKKTTIALLTAYNYNNDNSAIYEKNVQKI